MEELQNKPKLLDNRKTEESYISWIELFKN